MGKTDFKKIILLTTLLSIFSFELLACKLFTIDSYTVSNDKEVLVLKKKFRFNKIKHISIYDENITRINKLISLLDKNKKGIESISLITNRLNDKYQVFTRFKLKHVNISILNFSDDTTEFAEWISNLIHVESLSIECGVSKGISEIKFDRMKMLKLLEIGSDSISINDLKSVSSLSQLNSLIISTRSKLDYTSIISNMNNLKFLSLDISNTPTDAFSSFSDISFSIQNADTSTFKKLEHLCNIESISIYTSVQISLFKKIAERLNCHSSIIYYEKNKNWMPILKKS